MNLDDPTWPRTTDRLSIRPYADEDAEAVFAYSSHPDVARWLARRPRTVADVRTQLAGRRDRLVVEIDGRVVGGGKVTVEDGWGQDEVLDRVRPAGRAQRGER